jgi:malate dehydrogenase (oxaloacetate-decarboxylating)(NADP+)
MNALELQGKKIEDVNIVCVGAGAAGVASMNLLTALGANKQKLLMVDSKGVLSTSRTDLNSFKQQYAVETDKQTLADACNGADVFIGVSGPNILTVDMLKTMAAKPIVFALSNPDPEIAPAAALAARDDLVMATGRSDYPNQINNVLGFPFLFRGALDVRARCINSDMLKAAVMALAELAREPVPADVLAAYGLEKLEFGKDYIIPKPFDKRLRERVPKAVAQAAIDSGVARLPMPY